MGKSKAVQKASSSARKIVEQNNAIGMESNTSSRGSLVRKQSRIGKGKHILPPSESDLNGHLKFTKRKEKDMYKEISQKPIIPCKYIHHPTMKALNIKSEVLKLIGNIGWESYFAITYPAYIELVREFYTNFEFHQSNVVTLDTPKVVQFRLMGKEFKLSLTEFNLAFGFIIEEYAESKEYLNSVCDFTKDFDPYELYGTLSTATQYNPSNSKDTYLRDPALKYIHRFLAFTFSGRKDSALVLTKIEFFFLWCMQNKVKANLGCWLVTEFAHTLKTKRHLILGSLITHLAVHENLIDSDDNDLHVACEMKPLDLSCLEIIGLIEEINGVYSFYSPRRAVTRAEQKRFKTKAKDKTSRSSDQPSTSSPPSQEHYDEELANFQAKLAE